MESPTNFPLVQPHSSFLRPVWNGQPARVLAFLTSVQRARRKPTRKIGWLEVTVTTLFHVSLAITLIVDLLHWGVLWPILSKTPNLSDREHFRKQTFSWTSYNTHVLNFGFMLLELMLNTIPLQTYLMGFGGFFSSAYGIWAFSVYTKTNRWIYPFLNASKPGAIYVYCGIYVGHWLIFGLAISLFYARDKLLGTQLAPPHFWSSFVEEAKEE